MAGFLGAVYPLALVLGMFAVPAAGLLLRAGLLVAAAPGLVNLRNVRPAQMAWFALLAAYLVTAAVSAFFAVDPGLALADLPRQVFIVIAGAGLSLALLDRQARSGFVWGCVGLAFAATAVIFVLFGTFSDLPLVGPVQETFKSFAADRYDVALNSLTFTAVLAAALGLPHLIRRPVILLGLASALMLAALASGSRTTLFSLIVAAVLASVVLAFYRTERGIGTRIAPFVLLGVAVVAAWLVIGFWDDLLGLSTSPTVNDLTTGRLELWSAALAKFAERPWFGWGAGSFPNNLGTLLPALGPYSVDDVRALATTGGAHNAFLTVMAERGVLAVLVSFAIVAFLLVESVRLVAHYRELDSIDRTIALMAPFVTLLLVVRGLGELPGWFGYADSLVDYLAYGAAALIVAEASQLDRRRVRPQAMAVRTAPA